MGRKPMTEQEKAERKAAKEAAKQTEAVVEATKAAQEAVQNEEAKPQTATYTEEEVRVLMEKTVAQAVQEALARQPQIIRVSNETPVVKMLFQCECNPENIIYFGVNGKFGSITGRQGRINVTKEAFLGEFRDALAQELLATRQLIVLDGLTDEERKAHGVFYGENEFLSESMFNDMLNNADELVKIYPDLCEKYKDFVAVRFATAYDNGDKRVKRDLVVKLNDMSKSLYADLDKNNELRKGAFYPIIERMNAKYEQE